MNRTAIFLAAAGALALIALIIGLPRLAPGTGNATTTVTPLSSGTSGDGSIKMAARLSHRLIFTEGQDVFATVDLTGVDVAGSERVPVNFAIVIDRSGSMSGFKLNQAKEAAKQLVAQLRGNDRLAIIHYGSDVKSLPSMLATPENKQRMINYIDGIWDDGGTNIGAGLTTARDLMLAQMAEYKVNRMILISDGQPTEGITDAASITQLAGDIRRAGISVSAIGVGTDFNEDLMQSIAEMGTGAYGYLNDASQLASLFQKDLAQATTTVARNVTLTFTVPAGVTVADVYGYRFTQNGSSVRVSMPDFSASQVERVVARFAVTPGREGARADVTDVALDYVDLLKNNQVDSSVKLAAVYSGQLAEVDNNRDKDAMVFAARAQGAWNTSQAADALKAGDRARAKELLEKNNALFDEAAKVAGEGAVAQDRTDNKGFEDDFTKSTDYEQSAKAAKHKARINYGLMGSTY